MLYTIYTKVYILLTIVFASFMCSYIIFFNFYLLYYQNRYIMCAKILHQYTKANHL